MPTPDRHVCVLSEVARVAHPLAFGGDAADYGGLLREIGEARLVLIGEATHGTHDFYRERARITRMLIAERGFTAVAVEADWPDAYRVNRFVRGDSSDADAREALSGFRKFPAWMWRNLDVLEFTDWLRGYNRAHERQAGFYGFDLYSMYASMQEVLRYLDKTDPEAAARARYRYSCFDEFGENTQAYGYAAGFEMTESCEKAVVDQLVELRRRAVEFATRDGRLAESEIFSAEQNALLVRNAERYYREMFGSGTSSWNVRDRHMAETLDHLLEHLGPESKIVVWAHNSHLGDARATEMSRRGELNLGQLVREKYGSACFLLGFTTYSGEVTAASNWDAPAERKVVRHALEGSIEALFHAALPRDFLLCLREKRLRQVLAAPLLERAIGVIYQPETERVSHYFKAQLPDQFDAVIHIDRTRALVPMEKAVPWQPSEEAPETYPSAM
jgi:erythromycin esterase-like protein